jgi:hypothetical protein
MANLDDLVRTVSDKDAIAMFRVCDTPKMARNLQRLMSIVNDVLGGDVSENGIKAALLPADDISCEMKLESTIKQLMLPIVSKYESKLAPVKGVLGEDIALNTIAQYFPTADICPQHAHAGDIAFVLNGVRIMVEVKNYGKSVPSTEVDKFKRDIVENKYNIGIFVSYGSPIACKDRLSNEIIISGGTACLAIYVPNADFSGIALMWAVVFGIKWFDCHKAGPLPPIASADQAMSTACLEELGTLSLSVARLDSISALAKQMEKDIAAEIDPIRTHILTILHKHNLATDVKIGDEFKCLKCGRLCANKTGLKLHERTCR